MNKLKNPISFGDKIFARVTRNGKPIYNFVSERVANMADLVSQLRILLRGQHGLVIIHVRNYNRGWGEERPLMLYAPKQPWLYNLDFSDVKVTGKMNFRGFQ